MAQQFDLIIIGAGPGGYVCAIRAAQLGMKVAIVDKRGSFGGTCLNVGCIPSKALLHASERFEEAAHGFEGLGFATGAPILDLKAMMAYKDKVVSANTAGIDYLFKKNNITGFHGAAKISAAGQVDVAVDGGDDERLTAPHVVVATGSESAALPGIEIDEKRIVSSTGALALKEVPKRLCVVGAGVIGLELGSVWRRLGAEVTVIEYLDHILPGMDGAVVKQFTRILKKQGMKFHLKSKVDAIHSQKKQLQLSVSPAAGGEEKLIEADVALIAIGRRPFTGGLGLEALGVAMNTRGQIETDAHFKTSVEGIYAIGDVIAGPMLAHKAEDEGVALAEILAGQAGHVNYEVIPGVVYTSPEVASVGKTEEALKAEGTDYVTGSFSFSANGRARAMNTTDGMVKILADKDSDRVLGVHIIGPFAGELIAEAAVAMEFGASAEDIARSCHAHPTLSEAVKEAALAVGKRAIHM
ncbi:MAG: dihydrolipoyl dehydrogenase [Hyphomicrobiales bacterium]|nr:MAG: dihydrolipoyl dehydrogenase [Hyphomicrobiales bacterium]